MTSKLTLVLATVLMLTFLISEHTTHARYLPTRSNGDRIDKLRELLKDLLESELEKEETDTQRWRPDSKYLVKRDTQPHKITIKSA
ncbi:unnamed protein product [Ceutorhynchus assimilis]|uniref:Proctolin n=1 Tax=Ceutorhynchus assimilis TaxID=467358 RepID=A0A9N9MUA8_9CUCU|nr:unnamed protein product [Ceutorhynchus assimilis]